MIAVFTSLCCIRNYSQELTLLAPFLILGWGVLQSFLR